MKNFRHFRTALTLLFFTLLFSIGATAQQTAITELGALDNNVSTAVDINDSGLAVINSTDGAGKNRAFVYRIATGEKITVPTLGGSYGLANAVNNSGKVVGHSETSGGEMHAYIYDVDTNQITDLHDSVSLGGNESSATAINDSGLITGFGQTDLTGDVSHAFVYDPSAGQRIDIGTLGGADSWATDINEAGVVVGKSQVSESITHAFRYDVFTGILTDIGALGGDIEVYGINNNNQVVGLAYDSFNKLKAFRSAGQINPATDILFSGISTDNAATGINDRGDVVGKVGFAANNDNNYAFLYSGGTMKNLNDTLPPGSNITLTEAVAINNSGQIVANGFFQTQNSTNRRAYLVTPAYSISGVITNGTNFLSGVTVDLLVGGIASAMTNTNGEYSFTNLTPGANYTITPSLTNYTFTPASIAFYSLAANQTANFVGTPICSYAINPTSASVSDVSSTGNIVAVTATQGCAWTASTTNDWITITSRTSGNGNGSVIYTTNTNNASLRTGTITIAGQIFTVNQAGAFPSYESDVSPRSVGDGYVDSDDIQQIRRFSVGLDKPFLNNEFQRADNSPRSSSGDGFVDSDDVEQARRYSIGLDARQSPGGALNAPLQASVSDIAGLKLPGRSIDKFLESNILNQLLAGRAVRAANQTTSAGQTVTVSINVDTTGVETGHTFSLTYDSTKLTNPIVSIGESGGDVVANTTTDGEIGISVTSFAGGTIARGNDLELVNVTFTAIENAETGTTDLTFTDTPARRKVSAADPNYSLQQPTFTNGTVTITAPTAARTVTVSGSVTDARRRGISNATIHITKQNGEILTTGTNSFGHYTFKELTPGETYIFNVFSKRHQFNPQVVMLTEGLSELNFTVQ